MQRFTALQLRLAVAVHYARTGVVIVLCGPQLLFGLLPDWWHDALYSFDRTPGPVGCLRVAVGSLYGEHGCLLAGVPMHMLAGLQLVHADLPHAEE